MDLATLFTAENGLALVTLTALEIVLGIDNIVIIAILVGKLPESQRARARTIGLSLAMLMRIALLLLLGWIIGLTKPLFGWDIFGWQHDVSGRDLILSIGGLFLIAKATSEIHDKIEGGAETALKESKVESFGLVIVQILLLDIVFSLDSVITAVGMAQEIAVMIAAVIIAVGAMLVFAGSVSAFIDRHPTIKMLALTFLLLIGFMLIIESLDRHVPKGYIYFAMAFSLAVEGLNIRARTARERRKESAS